MKARPNFSNASRMILSLLVIVSYLTFTVMLPIEGSATSRRSDDARRQVARGGSSVGENRAEQSSGTQFKRLPLRFELNVGQTSSEVRFTARSSQGTTFLTAQEAVLRVFGAQSDRQPNANSQLRTSAILGSKSKSAVLRLHTVGSNPHARITGLEKLPGWTNYFIGNDPKHWRTKVPGYAKVKYEGIYRGIDMIYYGNEGNLEYDFNVAPGADPGQIALAVEGAEKIEVDETGDLVLQTAVGEVRQHAPRIYQEGSSGRHEIAGGYVRRDDGKIGFALAGYDASRELVIDPELVYATYLGGGDSEGLTRIAVDAEGAAYVAGSTLSVDFPTKNPLQGSGGRSTAFVTKLSPDGSSIVYSTYFGGTSNVGEEYAVDIALDSASTVYIAGNTSRQDFPLKNSIQTRGSIFVTKLSTDGASLIYSTRFGGSRVEVLEGMRLDPAGHAFLFGETLSQDFPTVKPIQAAFGGGNRDGFVSVVNSAGTALLFSTYLGGNRDEFMKSVVYQPQTGDFFAFGVTSSSDFPNDGLSTERPYAVGIHHRRSQSQLALSSGEEACWQEFDYIYYKLIELIELFLGGDLDQIDWQKVLADIFLFIIITTDYVDNCLPVSQVGLKANAENQDMLMLLDTCTKILPSTTCKGMATAVVLDGKSLSVKSAFTIGETVAGGTISGTSRSDAQGTHYIVGTTTSSNFPVVNPIQGTHAVGEDAFVMVLPPGSGQPVFSTYLGGNGNDEATGLALDPQGNIYISGTTESTNFPTAGRPLQNARRGNSDAFIAKVSAIGPFQVGPDFALGFDSMTVTASSGTKIKLAVNITRSGGFTGNVSITPEPTTAKGIILPTDPVATTGGSVKFKVKIKGSAQPGSYPITFTGKDDSGKTHTATITLVIQ